MPNFSIITPSYNQLDWLRLCIASVQDQVPPPDSPSALQAPSSKLQASFSLEHIIQDAGTPGIENLARELGAEFHRNGQLVFEANPSAIRHPLSAIGCSAALKIFSEPDAGMYDAINRGIKKSLGQIIAWLNSDEQYLSGTLSKVAGVFHHRRGLDVLLGDAILLDKNLEPICYRRIMRPGLWHTRLDHLHSLSCSMFFKKNCLPDPPLNPHFKVISDAILMEHFLKKCRIYNSRTPLAAYTFTGFNLSQRDNAYEKDVWWNETKWPPKCLRLITVIHNRLRRLFCGSYRRFRVNMQIQTPRGKKLIESNLSGIWPRYLIGR